MTQDVYLFGTATAPVGGINLGKYPGLTHAPSQYGPGIRFAHNGRPVENLAKIVLECKDECRVHEFVDGVAQQLGVPFADVLDGLKFLRDQGAI